MGATAAAADERSVAGTRIELGELVPAAPERLRDLDLGPAPPPGGSRLFGRDEIVAIVRKAGESAEGLSIPTSIRATTEKQQLTVSDLAALGRAAIEPALPEGISVVRVVARRPVDARPGATLSAPSLPSFPKRSGPFQTTVIFPVSVDGVVADRIPLTVAFSIDDRAARPDVARGGRVSLIIERGVARISAAGIALKDTDVGELAYFRVEKTGRVVRAHLQNPKTALVTEAQ